MFRRPSIWWLIIGGICAVLAVASGVTAIMTQRSVSMPIGEGEVFAEDTARAREILGEFTDPEEAVRRVRNSFEVEAVSSVSRDGTILASTSPDLGNRQLSNPFLLGALSDGRMGAVAAAIDTAITIDGVVEWPSGSVLYQVVAPVDPDTSVLIHYDLAGLLGRRAGATGIHAETAQLLGLTVIFAVLGAGVVMGNNRAERRRRAVESESELLRKQSEMLQIANTELDQARYEAERALALAEEKIRIRSDLVLMINHELRTPLTSVVTGARLIQDGELPDHDRAQVLEAMITDGARLQEIIDQILAVARIENQGLSSFLTDSALRTVLEALEAGFPSIAPVAGGELTEGLALHTDARTLAMVLASLADNARTHGAERVSVGYGTNPVIDPMLEVGDRPGNAFYFSVTDDGPGIPEDFLPRLFEKFEKSSSSPGTGLGLYMARLMVEALQGSLAVATSPEGTTFQIAIPVAASPHMAEVS